MRRRQVEQAKGNQYRNKKMYDVCHGFLRYLITMFITIISLPSNKIA
jgi:hypothetical protein